LYVILYILDNVLLSLCVVALNVVSSFGNASYNSMVSNVVIFAISISLLKSLVSGMISSIA
jgi:hypothetical protein